MRSDGAATWQCGTGRFGTVFSVDIAAATEKVLHNFSGSDGATPVPGLIMQNGLLCGVTDFGGAYNAGTVFSLNTQGSEHVLHSFGYGNNGAVPKAALIAGPGTVLYGTTYYGGVTGFGTIFSISLSGVENVVHNFRDGYRYDGTFFTLPWANGLRNDLPRRPPWPSLPKPCVL